MISHLLHNLWNVLKLPWVLALVAVMFLIVLVWIFGPHIAFADQAVLASVNARIIATLALLLCWAIYTAFANPRQRKEPSPQPDTPEQHEEQDDRSHVQEQIVALKKCLKTAIRTVTTSNFYGHKGRSRYALPWYLILGVRHSGKTSMLLNSGLKFTLNEQADRFFNQIKSTDQCEAFYGNEAVFIDTPGDFTDSGSNPLTHKVWTALLNQLAKIRRVNPLNGVIVCMNMRDIITADQAKREQAARTLRARLSEVLKRLHSHVPVYLVFTKCDAIPGFAQFFNHLSRSEREQIFGCPGKAESMEPGSVRMEWNELMQTLNAQIIARVHQERDVASRGDIYRFPQEIASLGPRIEDFITDAFGPSRYHRPVMFRGFFFTSALSTHDVVVAAERKGEQSFLAGNRSSAPDIARGFFLLDLFNKFIIPESKLAIEDKEQRWPLFFKRHGLQLAAAGVFLFAAAFLGVSFMNNHARLEQLAGGYSLFAAELKNGQVTADAKTVLPELEKITATTTIYVPEKDSAFAYGLGLYQGRSFEKHTSNAYLGTLNARLMPSLRIAAAEKIDRSLGNVNELKSALRAYIMLCNPEHINLTFLNDWLGRQWSDQYLGQANVQQDLRRHMDYLLANGIVAVDPDAALVERARKALLKTPLAILVYQRMQEESRESGKPAYTFQAAIGESPFTGDTYAIPNLYTRGGYEEYLIKRCPIIIRTLTDEKWIFGESPMALSNLDVSKVHKEVRGMYFRDYARYWNQAMQALQVRTPSTMADARNLGEQMTAGVPPAVLVLRELRANTSFLPEPAEPDEVESAVTNEAKRKAQQKLGQKVGGNIAKSVVKKASNSAEELQRRTQEDAQRDALTVRQFFVPVGSLLSEDGNPGQALKAANDNMASTADYFGKLLNSDNREKAVMTALLDIADEKDDTLRRLEGSADRLPPLVRRWYSTVAAGGLREMLLIGAASVNRSYQDNVISVYAKNLRSHYPFNVHADKDVNLEDFAAFFRGNGVLDTFYDAHLRPFISRSGTLRSIMGRTLPVSSKAVVQLQLANRVQDAFFMSGRELGISFLMEPYALDAGLKQVSLNHGGKTLKYWHGPVQGAGFTWPPPTGQTDLTTLETSDLKGVNATFTTRGDWALFRLFQKGSIKRQEGNTCLLEVLHNDRWAQFLIQFRNKANPFDPAVCSFALPETLL
jgi:type VI secretion system protein ImpL